ncbi:MAG: permease, partial [Bacteroidales bacterium]|nr:permease [Bacteroidales bacterium]
LVFANWGKPAEGDTSSAWYHIWANKWYITGFLGLMLGYSLVKILKIKWQWVLAAVIVTALSAVLSLTFINNQKFIPLIPMLVAIISLSVITLSDKNAEENKAWTIATWEFAKLIVPLLALGVVAAGFLLGSTHDGKTIAGVIPNEWITTLVGGNSVFSNFFASVAGAFMYFATLTEVPIVQGLLLAGMGKGPALALLLAGPSLSLPSMLVIGKVIGTQKTVVYVSLVVVMATITGLIYGSIF